MSDALIVVLDVGKTNVKLVAHDRTGHRVHARSTPNAPLTGLPYDRVDVEGIWTFLLDGLREIARGAPVSDIIATTHGCAFACLDRAALGADEPGDGLALPVMDYEWEGVRAHDAAYDLIRPPFTETGSPALPVGLNGGRQLHYLMREHSAAFERVGAILPLPQYFAWRLSGGLAADPSRSAATPTFGRRSSGVIPSSRTASAGTACWVRCARPTTSLEPCAQPLLGRSG